MWTWICSAGRRARPPRHSQMRIGRPDTSRSWAPFCVRAPASCCDPSPSIPALRLSTLSVTAPQVSTPNNRSTRDARSALGLATTKGLEQGLADWRTKQPWPVWSYIGRRPPAIKSTRGGIILSIGLKPRDRPTCKPLANDRLADRASLQDTLFPPSSFFSILQRGLDGCVHPDMRTVRGPDNRSGTGGYRSCGSPQF